MARRVVLLVVAMALAIPSLSEAAALRAKVASVTDGDSVKLKIGTRTRAFSLAALNAPERTECFAAESKAKLKSLLPRNARVRAAARGRSATITRGRTNVNKAMVRGGFARAVGSKLASDEAAAKAAGVGLWTACAAGPTPPGPTPPPQPDPQPAPGDTTGQAAIDRMTKELENGRWRMFTSGSQSSTEYIFNLCADKTWLYTSESAFGGRLFQAGQPWKVTDGFIQADNNFRGAVVEATITNGDPPRDNPNFRALLQVRVTDGVEQWYWDGDPAQHFPGAANCTL